MRRLLLPFLLSVLILGAAPAQAASTNAPVRTLAEAVAWLDQTSARMIRDCRHETASGITAFPPQVGNHYDAFWLRDYAYMLQGNIAAFSNRELTDSCLFFIKGQRADGAMMDAIQFDGKPLYNPGGYRGLNPIADGSQFSVDVVWHTFQRTRDTNLVISIVDKLVKAMNAVPRNPDTGMVYIKPGATYDRVGYGFTDQVKKQGDEFFCSLLYIQASRQLGDLLQVADRRADAAHWRKEAQKVSKKISDVFWNPGTGLFRAATIVCNQPDIWGSAFAVYIDVADRNQSRTIAKYFKEHYAEIVKRGQLRHLPAGMFWEATSEPLAPGTFQNGAFWATPIGWFVYTLDLVDPKLADQTVLDMVNDFIAHGVNECINDGYSNVPQYLASAALPLEGIRAMEARRNLGKHKIFNLQPPTSK